MAIATSEQSTANKEYVRRLLRQRQPGFSAALELAVDLLGPAAGVCPRAGYAPALRAAGGDDTRDGCRHAAMGRKRRCRHLVRRTVTG